MSRALLPLYEEIPFPESPRDKNLRCENNFFEELRNLKKKNSYLFHWEITS